VHYAYVLTSNARTPEAHSSGRGAVPTARRTLMTACTVEARPAGRWIPGKAWTDVDGPDRGRTTGA